MKAKRRKADGGGTDTARPAAPAEVAVEAAAVDSRYPGGTVAVDVETTGLSAWKGNRIYAIAFFWGEGDARNVCYQWNVDPLTRGVDYNADGGAAVAKCKATLEDPDVLKVFHNWKFDVRHIDLAWGVLTYPVADTMHAATCCDTSEPTFALKPLAAKYLGIGNDDEDDLGNGVKAVRRTIFAHEKKDRKSPAPFPERAAWEYSDNVKADGWMLRAVDPNDRRVEIYNLRDCRRTLGLWNMYADVMEVMDTRKVYDGDLATLWTCYRMESRGVRIDPAVCKSEAAVHQRELDKAEALIGEEAAQYPGKGKFALTKLEAVGWLMYDQWGYPCDKLTPTGLRSTAIDELLPYIDDDPKVKALLLAKAGRKAIFDIFEAYQRHAINDPEERDADGKPLKIIHCNFAVGEAKTGRLACREPNLQNVASKEGAKKSPAIIDGRKPFCPRPGYRWYHPDYEQLEVRVFAALSGEQTLRHELLTGADIHGDTANRIWGGEDNARGLKAAVAALESIGSDADPGDWLASFDWDIVAAEASIGRKRVRNRAKALLFTKLFNGGPKSIRKQLACSYPEAVDFLAALADKYPRMQTWLNEATDDARRSGYAQTVDGRKITAEARFEYRAGNHRVQGSAADFVKSRMRAVESFLQKSGLDARLLLQIHDELILEVADRDASRRFLRDLKAVCEDNEGRFNIPTPVDIVRTRANWSEKEKIPWAL